MLRKVLQFFIAVAIGFCVGRLFFSKSLEEIEANYQKKVLQRKAKKQAQEAQEYKKEQRLKEIIDKLEEKNKEEIKICLN